MLTVPPVPPAVGWRASTRLARDHYLRLDGNDYSVHPSVIGRRVEIIADLHQVRVLCDGQQVADHERLWAKHQTVSDPVHVEAAKLLRRKHLDVARATVERHPTIAQPDVEVRCLADYDTALGLTDQGVA
jgi:transposase